MKKSLSFIIMLFIVSVSASASNLDNIYGKQESTKESNFNCIYGSNFGSLVQENLMAPYCMDINVANNEIQALNNDNGLIESEISKYNAEIALLTPKIEEIDQTLIKINELLESVNMTSGNLYSLSTTLTDTEMKKQLFASIEENKQQKFDLSNKRDELIDNLEIIFNKLAIQEKNIIICNLFTKQNNNRIDFLNQCISLTNTDANSMDIVIAKSSILQNEVENLLKTSGNS